MYLEKYVFSKYAGVDWCCFYHRFCCLIHHVILRNPNMSPGLQKKQTKHAACFG